MNPKALAAAEAGWYFAYSPEISCLIPGFATPLHTEEDVQAKKVEAKVTGLQPDKEYRVCLVATNGEGETPGNEVAFKTEPAPPEILGESAPVHPEATVATLEAKINPNNQETTYSFEYATTAAEIGTVNATKVPSTPGTIPAVFNAEGEPVSAPTETLAQNTTYYYRVVAENTKGEKATPGTIEHFKTSIPPETPEKLEAEAVGTGFKLKGILNPANPGNPGTYEFLYAQSTTACTTPTPPQAATGAMGEIAEGEVMGLLPNTVYTFCLRASNEAGEISALSTPVTLTTLAVAPGAGTETFTNVGSSSATLHAQVDPGGAPTTFFFEYGPTTTYGYTTPVESAGAGATPVSVLANIEQLQPNTQYHFRVVLNNTHGTIQGTETTFSTLPLAIPGLPDNRGYELVSPPNNGDATVVPVRPGARAAADGSKVTYLSTTPPTGGVGHGEPPPGEINQGPKPNSGDNQYLSERSDDNVWTTRNIQPAGVNTALYQSFSSDLSEAIVQSVEPIAENAPSGEYPGLYSQFTDIGNYRSLFTRTPSHLASPLQFEMSYAGTSGDGSHQLFEANEALLEGSTPTAEELNAIAGEKAVNVLYDSTGGRLLAVDVLPNGRVAPQASYGSPKIGFGSVQLGLHRLDRVVSTDGSRIFWTDTDTGNLYVRENDGQPDASTTLIAEGAEYQTASSDGSRVFFTDEKPLTTDSTATAGAPDLYEAELATSPGTPPILRDLTPSTSVINAGDAHVMGVLGASEDGSYVYFAAAGVLAPGAESQDCAAPPPRQEVSNSLCNVYVLHAGESPTFVATVTYTDGEGGVQEFGEAAVPVKASPEEYPSGDWVPAIGDRTAEVSPDGRHLVFESIADLTGYDGGGSREIYMYQFGSMPICVSCNPTGAPTLSSKFYARHFELPESFSPTYALRDMSADGDRVFFNSKEALVADDENDRTDVYEWEAPGEGTCAPGGHSYSSFDRGCLYLLSGGTSAEYSAFLDADESGENVFFASRAQLVPQDKGEVYGVYDARVGAASPIAAPVCTGSGCQGVPAAPPIFATPASVTFGGIGNFPPPVAGRPPPVRALSRTEKLTRALKECRKDRTKKKRAGCEKSARKRYGAPRAKKK